MNNQKIFPWVLFIIIVIVSIIGITNHNKAKKQLKEEHVVACATIISIKPNRSGGGLLTYELEYNGVLYKKRVACLYKTKIKFSMGMNRILVLIQKENPSNSDLLEVESDFIEFNIRTKDTMGLNCSSFYY